MALFKEKAWPAKALALVSVLAVAGLIAASGLLGAGGETGDGANPSGGAAGRETPRVQNRTGGHATASPATESAQASAPTQQYDPRWGEQQPSSELAQGGGRGTEDQGVEGRNRAVRAGQEVRRTSVQVFEEEPNMQGYGREPEVRATPYSPRGMRASNRLHTSGPAPMRVSGSGSCVQRGAGVPRVE